MLSDIDTPSFQVGENDPARLSRVSLDLYAEAKPAVAPHQLAGPPCVSVLLVFPVRGA